MNILRDFSKYNEMYNNIQKILDPHQPSGMDITILESIANDTKLDKGIKYFWKISDKFDIVKNPMVTWKFCILLHYTIINGNLNFIKEIKNEMDKLIKINNLNQIQMNPCYGPLNQQYIHFILTKIDFHKRNEIIQSSIDITFQEILLASNNQIDYLFRTFANITNYIEHILNLYRAIESSLASMPTGSGLRVIPLPLLVAESNKLYHILKDLMFYLHQTQLHNNLGIQRIQFSKLHNDLYIMMNTMKTGKRLGLNYNYPTISEICPRFTHNIPVTMLANENPPPYDHIYPGSFNMNTSTYPQQYPTYPITTSQPQMISSTVTAQPSNYNYNQQPMMQCSNPSGNSHNNLYPQLPIDDSSQMPMPTAPPIEHKTGLN